MRLATNLAAIIAGILRLCRKNFSVVNVVFNAVMLFRFLRVVPTVGRSYEIQFVIAKLFILTSASRPAVQHIFSRF